MGDGALRLGEWAIVAEGDEGLDSTYEVFYQNRLVSRISGMFEVRDFVAIQSAIARAGVEAACDYNPVDETFLPNAPLGTPEFDRAVKSFEGMRRAIKANPGV